MLKDIQLSNYVHIRLNPRESKIGNFPLVEEVSPGDPPAQTSCDTPVSTSCIRTPLPLLNNFFLIYSFHLHFLVSLIT